MGKNETKNQWNLNQEIIRENRWNQSWFFETINKTDKPLVMLIKKKHILPISIHYEQVELEIKTLLTSTLISQNEMLSYKSSKICIRSDERQKCYTAQSQSKTTSKKQWLSTSSQFLLELISIQSIACLYWYFFSSPPPHS